MSRLIYGGTGFVLGVMVASAVFVALPDGPIEPPASGQTTALVPPPPSAQVQPLTEAEQAEEDRFLDLDLGAEDAPAVEPLENATNTPYASCEKSPELAAWLGKRGNATYARRRDMHFYLTTTNVLATKDCTCSGKMLPVSTLMAFETRLMEEAKVNKVEDLVTLSLHDEARDMRWQAEELCGGRF